MNNKIKKVSILVLSLFVVFGFLMSCSKSSKNKVTGGDRVYSLSLQKVDATGEGADWRWGGGNNEIIVKYTSYFYVDDIMRGVANVILELSIDNDKYLITYNSDPYAYNNGVNLLAKQNYMDKTEDIGLVGRVLIDDFGDQWGHGRRIFHYQISSLYEQNVDLRFDRTVNIVSDEDF